MRLMPFCPRLCRPFVLAAALLVSGAATAAGLQVSPTTLTLQANEAADGLWLSNSGDAPISAQVRVYQWTQDGGEDRLAAGGGVTISPPMLSIPPGGKQLVRVIRTGGPVEAAEEAYRVVVDELPLPEVERKPGLQFVLRYSVPVFLSPATEAVPDLSARWSMSDGGVQLHVRNDGSMHAQVADLDYVDARGQRHRLRPGLLGYVLPGREMAWPLEMPAGVVPTGDGRFEARINGEAESHAIPAR